MWEIFLKTKCKSILVEKAVSMTRMKHLNMNMKCLNDETWIWQLDVRRMNCIPKASLHAQNRLPYELVHRENRQELNQTMH